ncbi:serine hydrolase [Gelidibacter algens]|uniref:serine hydrolase n=1 Tax=Gelidibacter algens TaxID=49280 RepID=UPI000AF7AACD|nr:serine hydrolase [Gelidibacter algens]
MASAQSYLKEIDAYLKAEYPSNGPGFSFLIAKKGKPIYQKAFGMANMESNIPMSINHVFEIGSMTKQFTAVSILMLGEDGKLNLEDDITKYIPDYPTQNKKITIQHLLNHTSGIKSYTGMANFRTRAKVDISPKELIDTFKNEPMDFAPGEKYQYNNSGYILLGYIIENITGDSYSNFIESQIFKPLDMTSTSFGSRKRIIANRALGYSEIENGYENADYLSMSVPYAAGAIMSTTGDLLKWQNALNTNTLITEESYIKAANGSTLNDGTHISYGFGLEEGDINGSKSIEHGGGIFGYTTMGIYIPEQEIFVTGLTNCDCKDISGVTARIASIVIGKPYPDKKNAIKLSENELTKWVGSYKFEDGTIRFITMDKGQLYSQKEGSMKFELYPMTPTDFIFESGTQSYSFSERNGKKEVNFKRNGNAFLGIQTDRKPPAVKTEIILSSETLVDYTGQYELAPDMILEITTKDNQIFGQLTGQPSFELYAEKEDSFFIKVVEAQLHFNKDNDGNVTDLVLTQNGRNIAGKKIK